MNVNGYDTRNRHPAIVKENTRITPADGDEVRHIVLSVLNPRFSYAEGQTIGVLTPGPHPFGASYYHESAFKAFAAVSPRPTLDEQPALDRTLQKNAQEVWGLVQDPKTYVYVAGLAKTAESLDKAMAKIAGSEALWRWKKLEMASQGRWSQILYE